MTEIGISTLLESPVVQIESLLKYEIYVSASLGIWKQIQYSNNNYLCETML